MGGGEEVEEGASTSEMQLPVPVNRSSKGGDGALCNRLAARDYILYQIRVPYIGPSIETNKSVLFWKLANYI